MTFLVSTLKSFSETLKTFLGFSLALIWKWIVKPEQQLTHAKVLTTYLDWLSVSNTVVHFLPQSLSLEKKKNVWDVFPITILTSAWLHMNSLTQSLSRETTMALLSIAMSLTKKTYGIFHPCPLQTVWGCEGMQQKASSFMVSWQVCVLTTGSAVSNQTVFSKVPLHSVERKSSVSDKSVSNISLN